MRLIRNLLAAFGAVSLIVWTDCAWAWSNWFIPTGSSASVGFFDSPITKTLTAIAVALVVGVVALSWMMRSRRVALIAVSRMIEHHDRYGAKSYRGVWLAKRIVRRWKRINPDCRRRSVSGIKRIILAGYGLEPEMMPKAERKIPQRVLEETERDAYTGDNIVPIRRAA